MDCCTGREQPGVKHVFVHQAFAWDAALRTPEYMRELMQSHENGLEKRRGLRKLFR